MASILHVDLPSDEEDDDYDPTTDPTGEKGDVMPAAVARGKRSRTASAAAGGGGGGDDSDDDGDGDAPADEADPLVEEDTPAQRAKKAKASALWEQLQLKAAAPSKPAVSLASLCKPAAPGKKMKDADALWMKNLGLGPKKPQTGARSAPSATAASTDGAGLAQGQASAAAGPGRPAVAVAASCAAVAAAAAALAAAREGASAGVAKSYNTVTITETRRFAGKDIEVTLEVNKDSKEALKASERQATKAAPSGLDAILSEMEKKKKVNVLDKSKMDWKDLKKGDASLEEELEAHKRSGAQYLDRKDFLSRAELREYEIERDKRLASDVRTRGRL